MSFQYSARGLKPTTSSPITTRPGLLVYGYNLVPTFIAQKVSSSVGNRLTHLKAGRSLAVMKSFTYLLALSLEHTFFVFRLSKWLNFRTKKVRVRVRLEEKPDVGSKVFVNQPQLSIEAKRKHWAIAAVWPDVAKKKPIFFQSCPKSMKVPTLSNKFCLKRGTN